MAYLEIEQVIGREILDSRGNPTVEVEVTLDDGTIGRAEVTFGHTTYDFPVYINGVIQDEFAEMPYAD